jgi:signal transduction histidine kinase
MHTLLAFLAIIGASVVSFDIRKKSVLWKYIFLAFFVYTMIVNFVSAIWHLNPLYYIPDVFEFSADLIEMLLLGLLLFGALIPTRFTQSESSVKLGTVVFITSTFGTLFLYGGLYYFVLPYVLALNPIFTGVGFGTICVAIYIALFIILRWRTQILHRFDAGTMVAGLILMVISAVFLLVSYFVPLSLMPASMMLRATMMVSLFLTVSIPVQKELGISEKRAEIYASSLALLAVIPYTLTLLAVAFIPLAWVFPEQGIYTLTHLILAFLAAVIVRLLWLYTRQQTHWHRYPLILCFLTISIVEFTILVLSPWVEMTGEFTLLYAISGLLLILWLYQAVRWVHKTPKRLEHHLMRRWLSIHSAFILVVILVGVLVQNHFNIILPWVSVQLITRVILLTVCLLATLFTTYLFIVFIQVTKDRMSMGFIVLGTLSIWIIANMIRVHFFDWTAGWWIAQFMILFGFMLGPATLGWLYLTALERSERERKRATLYADSLVHDLRNYHTVIQTSLDLLSLTQDPSEVIDTTTDNIQLALNRADRLITNVRSLEVASSLKPQDLIKIDVVAVINEAWEHIIDPDDIESKIAMNQEPGQCFVLANDLLLEVVINLFRNALQYSEDVKRIQVEIEPVEQQDVPHWKISVIDWGRGISPEQKAKLFTRYTEGAKGLGLGLSVVKSLSEAFGGSVTVENRVADDYSKGTVFILMLIRSN